MNRLLRFAALAAISAGGFLALAPVIGVPAEAAACVRGVRGAACAGPRGAVAVRRRPVVVAPARGAVVVAPARRGVVVAPVRRTTVIVR